MTVRIQGRKEERKSKERRQREMKEKKKRKKRRALPNLSILRFPKTQKGIFFESWFL